MFITVLRGVGLESYTGLSTFLGKERGVDHGMGLFTLGCLSCDSSQVVHLDFAELFQGAILLITVDAHSKWSDAFVMFTVSVTKTMDM